ncbi:hypothetical protein AMK59_8728, partial [Oryctes borbonicus]
QTWRPNENLEKMAKWNTSETGILRKKVIPENHEDLLVFGYACKLFRDDEKAKYIDQGKHLIPWMGDETLRIDRYDCRGALSDLSSYESSREGYDAMRWLGLSDSERKIEQLCDEERYYSLHANEEEDAMYKEEELKRLQQKTNEFAYSYDVPQNPATVEPANVLICEEEEDKEYVPKPELNVPADITIPKTEKENARIEKTASFVCKQGPQMEILIKTKQANNPQFSFLNQSDTLYKYYKHVLNALKTGIYKIESNTQEEDKKETVEQDTNDDHYLHPSLVQTSVQATSTLPTIPTVIYKPTADCAYSQLVNRIQGSQVDGAGVATIQTNKSDGDVSPQAQNQLSYEQQQQQYYQYYYTMQYYEYYKQLVQQFHSMGGTDGQTIPPLIQEQINAQAAAFAQMAYTQYIQQSTSNPYSQLVSNLAQATKDNIYTPVPQNVSEINQAGDITKAPIIYSQTEVEKPQPQPQPQNLNLPTLNQPPKQEPSKPISQSDKPPRKHAFPLVHYGSDSEEETGHDTDSKEAESNDGRCKIPPDETKLIIDKMASYVAKNGRDFEAIVKSKGDPRFEFLNEEHEYHAYYKMKIKEFGEGDAAAPKEASKSVQNGVQPTQKELQVPQPTKLKDKKVITPVSFSIKKPKEEIPKDIKSALPIEESDEETPEEAPPTSKESTLAKTPEILQSNISITSATTSIIKDLPKEPEISSKESPLVVKEKSKTPEKKTTDNPLDGDDPILEMIDLTEDLEEKKDAKRAEDRIKDKLAAAAREKLALVYKDRALQMERKKKAAAFLKLKSAESDKSVSKSATKKDDKMEEDKVLVISDSDNNKVESEKEKNHSRSRSGTRDSYSKRDESDSEEGEIKKRRKSKKKKSHHKRKRSRSRHRSRSHYKKVKKRRKRSESYNETSSSDD